MGCAASVTAQASDAPLRRTAPGWASDGSARVTTPNIWRAAAPGLQSKEKHPNAAADGRSSDAAADATVTSTDARRVGAEAIGPLQPCVLTGDLYQRQAAKRTRRQKLHRRRLDRIVAAERYSENMLVQSERLSLRSLSSRAAFSTRMCTPATPTGSLGASGDSNVGVTHTPECDRYGAGVLNEGPSVAYRVTSSKPAVQKMSDADPEPGDDGEGRATPLCPENSTAACIPLKTVGGVHASPPPTTDDDVSTLPCEAAATGGQFCHRLPEPSEGTAGELPLPTQQLSQLKCSPPPSAMPLQHQLVTEQAAGSDCPKLAVCDVLAPPPHELQPLRAER